jgi:hypothetical protein
MELESTIIIGIILLIIYEYQTKNIYEYFSTDSIISSIDKRPYKVISRYTNKTTAADIMAQLHDFIIEFLRFLKNKFIINRRGTNLEQNFAKRLLKNYNPDVVFENDPKPGEDTSFVVNKGKKFAICLRSKKTKRIHNLKLLQFVVIHEMTHLGTITYGHDYQFWSWMKFLLTQSKEAGLYNPVNYKKSPTTYCGIDVTYSPYYSNEYDWNRIEANLLE